MDWPIPRSLGRVAARLVAIGFRSIAAEIRGGAASGAHLAGLTCSHREAMVWPRRYNAVGKGHRRAGR